MESNKWIWRWIYLIQNFQLEKYLNLPNVVKNKGPNRLTFIPPITNIKKKYESWRLFNRMDGIQNIFSVSKTIFWILGNAMFERVDKSGDN